MNGWERLQRGSTGRGLRHDGAAFFERRMNKLQRRRRHLKRGVDAQRQLIDGRAVAQRFQNSLPIFASPFVQRTQRLRAGSGFGALGKRANVRSKFRDVRRLKIAAVRAKHGVKTVRGGKDNFGHYFSALNHQRGRQQIFNIVREFTELTESASGGVALERVHRAPDASQGLGVRWIGFQEDSRLVQLLQLILRALKEEFAKFGRALIGEKVHSFASMR
jgi:hypothetical protein